MKVDVTLHCSTCNKTFVIEYDEFKDDEFNSTHGTCPYCGQKESPERIRHICDKITVNKPDMFFDIISMVPKV